MWDVSLHVEREEIVTLIGSNGAGKSSILQTIAGLLVPTNGTVLFHDRRIDKKAPQKIVELGLCMVPEGRKLFHDMTVFENLEMGSILKRARKAKDENLGLVYDLFPVLEARKRQPAGTLSGGEQQMLAIGRALLSDPTFLILDEVSQGLAPLVIQNLSSTIRRINRHKHLTIFFAEQNLRMALKLSDRAYIIESGRIVGEGDSRTLFADRGAEEACMGIRSDPVRTSS